MISDMVNAEIGSVAFGVDENYQWQLLDLILEANKVVFILFEKTATNDVNTILAIKKLRTRLLQANEAAKSAIMKLQKETYNEHSKDQAVASLNKKIATGEAQSAQLQ